MVVFRPLDWEGLGVSVNGEYLSNLRFADVIARFSSTGDELQQTFEDLYRESKSGSEDNCAKAMVNSLAMEQEFRIANQPLESVTEYVFWVNYSQGTLIMRRKFTEE